MGDAEDMHKQVSAEQWAQGATPHIGALDSEGKTKDRGKLLSLLFREF